MSIEPITERCEAALVACLDDVLAEGRGHDLAKRLEVVTKATRYLETVTHRKSVVRHIYDREVSDSHA